MKKLYMYLILSIFLSTQNIAAHFESRRPITALLFLRIAQLATTSYQPRSQSTRTSLQPFPHPHHTSPAITERVTPPTTTEPMKRYKYL